jgi:hypothetical protein
VRQAIASDRKPREAGQPRARDGGPPTQAEVLCERGKQTLRDTWRSERDKTADNLAKSFDDAAEQEKNAASEALKMRDVVGLDDRQAAEVARASREKRLARVAEARAALAREPRDFAALLATLRGLFADEDAILERVAGASAKEAWRAEQHDGRTILMALFAAMADRDWEESIRW